MFDYASFCKVIGKLAYWYDIAGTNVTAGQQALAALMTQVTKPDAPTNNPTVLTFAAAAPGLNANITNGELAVQANILSAAINYLTGPQVYSYFVANIPAVGANAAAIITALIAEMTTDSKTFTTVSTTGIVHFLEAISAGASALPQSGGPTYADATYCVVTVL